MDVRSVGAAGTESAPATGKLAEAARDFEALLVSELLRAARAGSAGWLGGEDAASDSALGLAEQQLARAIVGGGGLGIARLVAQGLEAAATRSSSATPEDKTARP
jgi:Rod binding domain-containing protein